MGELRDREPVSLLKLPFGIRGWLVSGYDEAEGRTRRVGRVQRATSPTSSARRASPPSRIPAASASRTRPQHTRLRKMLTAEFTGHRLRRLGPRIDAIVAGQLDEMARIAAEEGQVDLVQSFALPIPSLAICELLGVPYEDRADFQRLSTTRFDFLGGIEGSLGAISESLTYLLDMVKRQRAEPGDGMLGMLVRQHGDDISDRELAGLADGLLTGGLETTTSMLALGAIVLLRDPELRRRLIEDDAAVDPFVDELLRYLTVVQVAFPRVAREAVTVGDRRIEAGDLVFCSLSAANRGGDPDLDRFDPARATRPHLAFGHGIHRCVGAELARMELRTAYPALLRRFPDIAAAQPTSRRWSTASCRSCSGSSRCR